MPNMFEKRKKKNSLGEEKTLIMDPWYKLIITIFNSPM